jgi:hypothetical protein
MPSRIASRHREIVRWLAWIIFLGSVYQTQGARLHQVTQLGVNRERRAHPLDLPHKFGVPFIALAGFAILNGFNRDGYWH